MMKKLKTNSGFTLVELLVVISIVGILIAMSLFGIGGARETSRDARRKADLEMIRSGLEIYKADCDVYPTSPLGASLVGTGDPVACALENVYLSSVPQDPLTPTRVYLYTRPLPNTYEICASLEQGSGEVTCGGSSNCGETCNYKVTNP